MPARTNSSRKPRLRRLSPARARLLEQAHIVTIPGAFGPAGDGYLRISYGYASQAELSEALRRLARFLSHP